MSDTTKAEYFCERCQVHWSGTHRCRDRIDAQRAIEAENQSLRAQLLAARAEALEDAAKMLDAMYDRDDCHSPDYYGVLRECAAALRAKGAGK